MAKILIVDSDPIHSKAREDILSRSSHKVTSVYSGYEALNLIMRDEFELAIIDLNTTDIDGINLLEAIRSRAPQILVLLSAVRLNGRAAIKALQFGAYGILARDIDEHQLIEEVSGAVEEGKKMKEAGYIYKSRKTKNYSINSRMIALGFINSLIVGASFYLSMIIQKSVIPLFIAAKEVIFLSLAMAFCYSFVYVYRRSYRFAMANIRNLGALRILSDLTYAYIIGLAMLFLIKDSTFLAGRPAIIIGFIFGFALLLILRLAFLIITKRDIKTEGRKQLILAGASEKWARAPRKNQYESNRIIDSREELGAFLSEGKVTELHLNSAAFSLKEILELMGRNDSAKYKIVLHKPGINRASRAKTAAIGQ